MSLTQGEIIAIVLGACSFLIMIFVYWHLRKTSLLSQNKRKKSDGYEEMQDQEEDYNYYSVPADETNSDSVMKLSSIEAKQMRSIYTGLQPVERIFKIDE